jgi:hypothetical protein
MTVFDISGQEYEDREGGRTNEDLPQSAASGEAQDIPSNGWMALDERQSVTKFSRTLGIHSKLRSQPRLHNVWREEQEARCQDRGHHVESTHHLLSRIRPEASVYVVLCGVREPIEQEINA